MRLSIKDWKKIIFGLFIGGFLGLILWFGSEIFSASQKIFVPNSSSPNRWFLPEAKDTQLKGEGDGRINILLLGIGGGNHPGASLTDTIMLFSIDPVNKKAGLVSIPRDLYVKLNGKEAKINYAYSIGGSDLAKQTVSKIFDMPIHYFVQLDFEGLVKLVDAVGGVDIYVDKAISDPYYPASNMKGYDPFYIKAGQYHMDGKLALKYIRSRETTSDFDRSARQQKFIRAFWKKTVSLNVLTNPKTLFSILNVLSIHLRTDLTIGEIQKLAGLFRDFNPDDLATKVLDSQDGLLVAAKGMNGYYLVPKSGDFKEIQKFVHQFLTEPYLQQEAARIEIKNGSGESKTAKDIAQMLKEYGYQVTKISTASKVYPQTIIYDYTNGNKPATVSLLKKRLGAKIVKVSGEGDDIDILVLLGKDLKGSS